MSQGIASLHKILKDETRQKIIELLNEKGSLSYTELLDASNAGSTGLLNYHLKVLGDLLAKDESQKYILTDKGKVASAVLLQFPSETNHAQKRKAQKMFWSILALGQVAILASVIILYYLGIVDVERLTQASISFAMGIFLAIFGYRMQVTMPAPGSDKMKQRLRIAYLLGGACVGFVVASLGVGIVLTLLARPLLRYFWSDWYFVFAITIAPSFGALWGYWVGKRNDFNKPKWMQWIDEKTGFA